MKLHANIMGEGTPFLILHGFLGMSDNWKTLGRDFAEAGYQVHLLDQRNHGRSPHSPDFSYTEMAGDIQTYLQDHDLREVVLLGHSMGGKTAMTAALLFPEQISRLIIVDIAPKYYPPHHQKILEGLKAIDSTELESREEAEELLKSYVKEPEVRLFLLKNLYRKEKDRLALRLNLDVLTEKIENLGEAIVSESTFSGPTLFVKGERTDYILESDQVEIQRYFPDSEIVTISGAGHWVHAEKRREFYRSVMEFLRKS